MALRLLHKTKYRLAAALLLCLPFLTACGKEETPVQPEPVQVTIEKKDSALKGSLLISELMVKNHASFTDEAGSFPDYIELVNVSDRSIELTGFGLADGEDKSPWIFPECSIAPGERLLLLSRCEGTKLSFDFGLSLGESVYLWDAKGDFIDCALCSCDTADIALCRDESGQWLESLYPSPGFPNSGAGYEAWQESLVCDSPLVISEAMVYNDSYLRHKELGYCDWLEIKNVSDAEIELSDYWLSDDDDNYKIWRFPRQSLDPGECVTVLCSEESTIYPDKTLRAPFNLNAQRERIYLSRDDGSLADFVFLRDIPYGCSYGRVDGENGHFFFDGPSPGEDNTGGYRRVSASPVSLRADGVFEEGPVTVELSGAGRIYYSSDCSVPTTGSYDYEGPFAVESTSIIRAVCVEEGAMPSRPLTLSYIIGEGHSLPVLSLVNDDSRSFTYMYNNKRKDMEVPGSLSLYEEGGSFTIPCGIEMHGEASLSMKKKNMSTAFRSAYGQDSLSYDAFGGGVTEFNDFVLRSGQDFPSTIIRSELLVNLCLQYSDNVPAQRSKHCVLYINGEYSGLYVLMEKLNEDYYARLMGVDPDSVTVTKARARENTDFYREVIGFARQNDLTSEEGYRHFCEIVDIDSLIDWMIIEGYSANTDISTGNVRYCRSTEGDGKWRFMLYDMDSTMVNSTNCFRNVLKPSSTQCAEFIVPLMDNPDFAHRFLSRAGEVLTGALSDENVVAELDRLAALISPEVDRDYRRFGKTGDDWQNSLGTLRKRIINIGWSERCIDTLCEYFKLTEQQREEYFGR